jgi:choline kinase
MKKNKLADYETDALVAVAKLTSIPCLKIEDLIWTEIDDQGHLKRAREKIYPMVVETDLRYFANPSK